MRTKLVVNPAADRGRTGERVSLVSETLRGFNIEHDLVQTEAPGQAIELARQAAAEGYDLVVAVGGDGTCNEVMTGLLAAAEAGRPAMMGVIPMGSGNDFAYALGIPNDLAGACAVLTRGRERVVDVGRVTVDGQPRFFTNGVGLGLDGEVAIETRKVRRLYGFALYLWSALRVIGFGRWPYQVDFSLNGEQYRQPVTLFAVGNGPRAGGGFFLTPFAKPDDGLLDICYAGPKSKLGLLNLLPKATKGTHIHDAAVTLATSTHIKIVAEEGIPGHIDGEILCTAGKDFVFEIIPQALRVWS